MSRQSAWLVLISGVLTFFGGLFTFFNTSTAFVELERKLNLISGDLFSRLLTVELPGINMREQWDNSVIWVQAVAIILALDGVFLSWLGLSTLLSEDDWRRR